MRKLLLQIIFTCLLFIDYSNSQTAGTLTFSYTPVTKGGYGGTTNNALAVWIQTNAGVFVKTKLRYAGPGRGTSNHLPTYAANAGGISTDCLTNTNVTDATTGATLTSFTTKSITWDGKNVVGATNGNIVADGVYKVTIESTWNHGTTGGTIRSFSFTKGPIADIQSPVADANFTGISLNWTPDPLAVSSFSDKPVAIVYPNPSNGIFKLDLKTEIDNIKVFDSLGKEVYNQKIDSQKSESIKTIDLSNLENGIYVISITNDKGSTNYEVSKK